MTGPVQGAYTVQQIQELQSIWSDLNSGNANPQGLQKDISALQNLVKSFPQDSSQGQALGFALQNLQLAASSPYDWTEWLINAEESIAGTITPQLQTAMTPQMQSTIQNILNNFQGATTSQVREYLTQVTNMLVQAQGLPSSPQQMALTDALQRAIQGITGYLGNPQQGGIWSNEAYWSLKSIMPAAQATG